MMVGAFVTGQIVWLQSLCHHPPPRPDLTQVAVLPPPTGRVNERSRLSREPKPAGQKPYVHIEVCMCVSLYLHLYICISRERMREIYFKKLVPMIVETW